MTCHSQIWTTCRDAGAGAAELRRGQAAALDPRLHDCRITFISITASISRKASAATNATGQVGEMPLTRQAQHMYMLFCLDCHRDPAPHLRPREQVFNMHWRRTAGYAVRRGADGGLQHPARKLLSDCGDVPPMSAACARPRDYWRRLEELADSPEFAAIVEREVPRFRDGARAPGPAPLPADHGGVDGAGRAVGLRSGTRPAPARALCRAAAGAGAVGRRAITRPRLPMRGYAEGVLLEHQMGRPVKVEGNPRPSGEPRRGQRRHAGEHPDALRSAARAVDHRRRADAELAEFCRRALSSAGRSCCATGGKRAAAADRHRDLADLRGADRRPAAAIPGNALGPLGAARPRHGTQRRYQAFRPRRRSRVRSRRGAGDFRRRKRSDLDGAGSAGLCPAVRGLAAPLRHRRPDEPGLCDREHADAARRQGGSSAGAAPAEIAIALRYIAGAVGAGPREWTQSENRPRLLARRRGGGSDAASRPRLWSMPDASSRRDLHLLVNAINGALGAFGSTIGLIEPVAASPLAAPQSLAELAADMEAGKVDTLLMLDTNPVYTAPADLDFAGGAGAGAVFGQPGALSRRDRAGQHLARPEGSRVRNLERRARVQRRRDDPAAAGPAALWRAIRRTRCSRCCRATPRPNAAGSGARALAAAGANSRGSGEFEPFWHEALRAGIVAGQRRAATAGSAVSAISLPLCRASRRSRSRSASGCCSGPTSIWDGRFADNAWLLELPRAVHAADLGQRRADRAAKPRPGSALETAGCRR